MNIEGLSIHTLATELNQILAGGKIEKILQPTRYLFILKIRQTDQDYSLAISVDPSDPRMHLTQESRENPPEPSSLCMLLRKHLIDGRIAGVIQQDGLDRVMHIHIDIRAGAGRIDTKTLTIELAGKNSNLIFCFEGKIIDAARRVGSNTSRVRQIVPGIPYTPPPVKQRLNPLSVSAEALLAALTPYATLPLAKSLMAAIEGIGPLGVAEILFRAGLQGPHTSGELNSLEQSSLQTAFASFLAPYLAPATPAFVALDSTGHLLAISTFNPTHLEAPIIRNFPSLNTAMAFATTLTLAPKTTVHQETLRRVKTELDKLERKQILLSQELQDSQNAEEYRRNADLLMASLHLMSSGQHQIQVPDYFSDVAAPDQSPVMVEISLDPSLAPMANVQRYYKKYSRAKRAQELIQTQLIQCREDILYLDSIALALTDTITRQEILEIIQELIEAGYIQTGSRPRSFSKPSEPRRISMPSGSTLFVGKNNRQNDLVTFKTAQPRDLWFHTKDIPGSHVILKSVGSVPLDGDIEMAAHIAAWFSKARDSANVPVDYTERRYVKKPSGAKPGFVIYEKQKTLWVTPEPTTVTELMK
jgi:predicted ribosome quality control (RQC) complex YloA/Tae2 family protein